MHGRLATYRVVGDPIALSQRAEREVLPVLEAQPGFRGYTIAVDGDTLFSMSAWESRADAEAASAAIGAWVRDNMADDLELIETRFAEVMLSTSLGVSSSAAARA